VSNDSKVVPFARREGNGPSIVRAPLTAGEQWTMRKIFQRAAEDNHAPASTVYKALDFMLGENPMPNDLKIDFTPQQTKDDVLMLVRFTTHPGAIQTTLRVTKPRSGVLDMPLHSTDLEAAYHDLAPELTMYQVFSLKPSRSLLGALMGFGAYLVAIDSGRQCKTFEFAIVSLEGVSQAMATVRIPYE
jgi:hypothetical protein